MAGGWGLAFVADACNLGRETAASSAPVTLHAEIEMIRTLNVAATIALCAALGACRESTGPLPQAVVSVDADPYAYKNGGRVSAHMTVTVENTGPVTLYHDGYCSTLLEREIAGEWKVAWSPVCLSVLDAPLEIAPGESYSLELTPAGYLDEWGNPADGRYRVQVLASGRRRGVPLEMRRSAPFELRTLLPPAEGGP